MAKNSVCCALYLKKHTSYDCHLWYTCVKWALFHFFKILIFLVVMGKKGKKQSQMTKNYVCLAQYPRNHTSYDYHLWFGVLNDNIFKCFFHFFKTLIFQVVRRVKRKKMAQNDLKLCLSRLISQELYIIRSSFMVRMCNRIISPGFFTFVPNFYFWDQQWGKRAKNGSKGQKIMSVIFLIS